VWWCTHGAMYLSKREVVSLGSHGSKARGVTVVQRAVCVTHMVGTCGVLGRHCDVGGAETVDADFCVGSEQMWKESK
jgi:hypothetical protein